MGLSRVEKYKEYRKSILSSEDSVLKTPIDTNLNITNTEPLASEETEEAAFINKIIKKKRLTFILFFIPILAMLILLIIFGIKYF